MVIVEVADREVRKGNNRLFVGAQRSSPLGLAVGDGAPGELMGNDITSPMNSPEWSKVGPAILLSKIHRSFILLPVHSSES